MPVPVPLSSFQYVPVTQEDLDWADIPTVDLSKIDTVDGKKEQAQILIDAVRSYGFFYVVGYNIDQQRVDNQLAIGQQFYELPLNEKLKYEAQDLGKGGYNGYRPPGRRIIDQESGLTDRIEVYNIPKFGLDFPHNHPGPIAANIGEVEQFARDLHTHIFDHLFDLTSIALELPEKYLRDLHKYETRSEDHLRYMKYTHYAPDETEKIGKIWAHGHTDLGSYTVLARQPVCALQIKLPKTGEWKWVKPLDNSFTVNACDSLNFLTGGYIQSTIHRVAAPPKDQANVDRLGLLYFARPANDLVLNTIKSPLLEREGFTQNGFETGGHKVPTMEEWVVAKQSWQQAKGGYNDGAIILPGFQENIHKR